MKICCKFRVSNVNQLICLLNVEQTLFVSGDKPYFCTNWVKRTYGKFAQSQTIYAVFGRDRGKQPKPPGVPLIRAIIWRALALSLSIDDHNWAFPCGFLCASFWSSAFEYAVNGFCLEINQHRKTGIALVRIILRCTNCTVPLLDVPLLDVNLVRTANTVSNRCLRTVQHSWEIYSKFNII